MEEQTRTSDWKNAGSAPKIGLVKASLLLAVFLEVIPVEADAVYGVLSAGVKNL